jgi:hypothetical protein
MFYKAQLQSKLSTFLKKVGESKNQICSSGFLYLASIVAWSRHNAMSLDGPLHGNGFYGGLF